MLDFAWSIGGFIVAIGVLVAFHEFGHYWVARRCGVKVLRFSLGFGKPLWTHRAADGVEWVLSAVPLGGYVKMLDEREGPVPEAERAQTFNNASVGRRLAIVAAGPFFNFVLAALFYWLVFVIGVEGLKPMLSPPAAGSAAERAGLHEGDLVLKVEKAEVPTWTVLRTELIDRALAGGELRLQVRDRAGAERFVDLDFTGVRVDPEFLFNDIGLTPFQPKGAPLVGTVVAGSAADAAGLMPGDRIQDVNGIAMDSPSALIAWLRVHAGTVVTIKVQRGPEVVTLNGIIGADREDGKTVGRLGAVVAVAPELWQDLRAENRLGPVAAVPAAVEQTWRMSALTLKMLWRMVLGDVSVKNVSGPIQIAQVAGFSAQIGLVSFLSFMAIVSVSLGVLNLLPVPLLDGGHMLYYGIEALKGSPLSERMQEAGQRVGLTFLVMLMGLAFYNDIMRLLN